MSGRPASLALSSVRQRPALVLRNRQRARRVNLPLLRQIVATLLQHLLPDRLVDLGIHIVDAPEITRLNETFLHHLGTTDVITFDYATPPDPCMPKVSSTSSSTLSHYTTPPDPGRARRRTRAPRSDCPAPPPHGEIFVCLDEARSQARRFRTTWQRELVRYIIHGILHLLGYKDHAVSARQRMKRQEDRLLRHLAKGFDFRGLGR